MQSIINKQTGGKTSGGIENAHSGWKGNFSSFRQVWETRMQHHLHSSMQIDNLRSVEVIGKAVKETNFGQATSYFFCQTQTFRSHLRSTGVARNL